MNTATLRHALAAALLLALGAAPALAQTSNVTFQVDMNAALENCVFAPGGNITVRGSFNDWGNSTGNVDVLTDTNNDGIYTGTFQVPNEEIFYKFWATPPVDWEDGDNRSATITGDTVLPVVPFNKTFSDLCDGQVYEVYFTVDMQVRRLQGLFDPAIDQVFVAGEFQGWNATNPETQLQPQAGDPDIYEGIFQVTTAIGAQNPYKFTAARPNPNAPGTFIVSWEGNVNPDHPDGNRVFSPTGEETDQTGNGIPNIFLVPAPFFNNVGFEDIISAPATVRFEVDLRPAFYYLMDNGALPSDTQTGEPVTSLTGVWINGPASSLADQTTGDDWAGWGPEALGLDETRRLFDDGTQGDVVAGDSLYTRVYTFPAGTDRLILGKFGASAYDNEGGFAQNHNFRITEGEQVIRSVFGCIRRPDGTFSNTSGPVFGEGENQQNFSLAWQPYTVVDNDAEVPTCTVVRGASSTPTGVMPVALELRGNFPNPFATATTFEYALPMASHVSLAVYDLMGRRVATIVDEVQAADTYRVRFDAGDLASGTYLYRLVAGNQVLTQRMTVVR